MKRNKKGFTLVELIVVLVILAILMAIAIPALTGYIEKARTAQAVQNSGSLLTAVTLDVAEKTAVGETISYTTLGSIEQVETYSGLDIINNATINMDTVKKGQSIIGSITLGSTNTEKITTMVYYYFIKDGNAGGNVAVECTYSTTTETAIGDGVWENELVPASDINTAGWIGKTADP